MERCDDLAAVMYLEYVEEAGGPKWFDWYIRAVLS